MLPRLNRAGNIHVDIDLYKLTLESYSLHTTFIASHLLLGLCQQMTLGEDLQSVAQEIVFLILIFIVFKV